MKGRCFTIAWWLLLISIPTLAYIDDIGVFSNKSMAGPIGILVILLCCCSVLKMHYRNKEK